MSYSAHMNNSETASGYPYSPPIDSKETIDKAEPSNAAHSHTNVHPAERIIVGVLGAGLVTFALMKNRRNKTSAGLATLGVGLIARGVTGFAPEYALLRTGTTGLSNGRNATIPHGQGIKVERAFNINRPANELYEFWRNFENLPRFMHHLESVEVQGPARSRWTVNAPLGRTVAWDAEVINDVPGQLIAWKSLEDADIPNAGSVRFRPLRAGRGTEVHVTLEYNPPAGKLGAMLAKLAGEEPDVQVTEDLRRFKSIMETGEIPTNGTGTDHRQPQNTMQDELQPSSNGLHIITAQTDSISSDYDIAPPRTDNSPMNNATIPSSIDSGLR